MLKIILTLQLLLITLLNPATSYAQTTQNNLVLTLNTTNPTERFRIEVGYSGATVGNCLTFTLTNKQGRLIKSTETSADLPCMGTYAYIEPYTIKSANGTLSIEPLEIGDYKIYAQEYKQSCGPLGINCQMVLNKTSNNLVFSISPSLSSSNYSLTLKITPSSGKAGDTFIAEATLSSDNELDVTNKLIGIYIQEIGLNELLSSTSTDQNGKVEVNITDKVRNLSAGVHALKAKALIAEEQFTADATITITQDKDGKFITGGGFVCGTPGQDCTKAAGISCDTKTGTELTSGGDGISTAIGCIPTDPTALVKTFIRLAIGIAGGVALLLMIWGSFKMVTSVGNPDHIQEGRQIFTNAVIGLLFVIFSVLLMRLIGVDILGLDGLLLGT